MTVQFIQPGQLAGLLRDPAENGKTVILDVREDDYVSTGIMFERERTFQRC